MPIRSQGRQIPHFVGNDSRNLNPLKRNGITFEMPDTYPFQPIKGKEPFLSLPKGWGLRWIMTNTNRSS